MKTSWETVTFDDSPMRLYLCQPESTGAVPAIVVIQNQDGVAEFTQEMTRRVAEAGYVGIAPDLTIETRRKLMATPVSGPPAGRTLESSRT